MKLNPRTILYFISNNFDFIKLLFDLSKEDNTIKTEELSKICNENGIELVKLTELKIIKELPNSDFKLNKRYSDFLEFLFQEFYLSLPEQLSNRSNAVEDIFTKLQTATDKSKVPVYISGLIDVIDDFLNDIDSYSTRLLNDTESLKSSADSSSDLTLRIKKANFWIDEFIKPLNAILDKAQTKSIVKSISLISAYANQRKFEEEDYHIKRQFDRLYLNALNADQEINYHIKKLTRELLPLLDRIITNSQILSGLYHFIEDYNTPEKYIVPLQGLIKTERAYTYSSAYEADTLMYLEHFKPTEKIYIEDEVPEFDNWLPNTEYLKGKLQDNLPIENFYQWCFETLKADNMSPDMIKYSTISNLIFEKEFDVEFSREQKFKIDLDDVVLTLPKVKIYDAISE
jgi:hypothetical protein